MKNFGWSAATLKYSTNYTSFHLICQQSRNPRSGSITGECPCYAP